MKLMDAFSSDKWVEFPTQTPKYPVTYPHLPIDHYCDIADRVFISFLKAYRRFYVDDDITMEYHVSILGKRLAEFIQVTMPSHPEYNDEVKKRMDDIDIQLKSYMCRFEQTTGLTDASIAIDDQNNSLEEDDYRDDFESFDDDTDFWGISSKDETFTQCKRLEIESNGTDSLSVTSTAGSFVTEIPSVIFGHIQNSSSYNLERKYIEEQKESKNDSQRDAASESIRTEAKEANQGYAYDDVDYSFNSLLSHWKIHEQKAIEKKTG